MFLFAAFTKIYPPSAFLLRNFRILSFPQTSKNLSKETKNSHGELLTDLSTLRQMN